jgi:hypothetical protein
MSDPEEIIRAAEEVAGILESRGVGAIVIGAVALAAHGYVRFTEDLDLGVNTELGGREACGQAGWDRDSTTGKPLRNFRDGMSNGSGSSHVVKYAGTRNLAIAGACACACFCAKVWDILLAGLSR